MNVEALIRVMLFTLMLALAMPLAVRASDRDAGPAGADGISSMHYDPMDRRPNGPYDRDGWNKGAGEMYTPEPDAAKNIRTGSPCEAKPGAFGEVEGDDR